MLKKLKSRECTYCGSTNCYTRIDLSTICRRCGRVRKKPSTQPEETENVQ
jgi:hypothetical protein